MANINDVAKLAGVAKSTVSNVFHKKGYLSEDIIKRVNKACEELNYHPSFAASSLAGQRTGMYGFFIGTEGDMYDPLYGNVMEGMILRSAAKGMHLVVYFAVGREEMTRIMDGKGPIDGAILMVPVQDDYRAAALMDRKIETVMIGTPSGSTPDILHVDVDNVEMVYTVTNRLIAKGYRTFVLINGRADYSISQERNIGFYKALRENAIDLENCVVINTNSNDKEIYHMVSAYLQNHQKDVAVIDTWDSLAVERAFHDVGLGEENHCRIFPSSKIFVDYRRVGEESFDLLYEALKGEGKPQNRKIPYTIHFDEDLL